MNRMEKALIKHITNADLFGTGMFVGSGDNDHERTISKIHNKSVSGRRGTSKSVSKARSEKRGSIVSNDLDANSSKKVGKFGLSDGGDFENSKDFIEPSQLRSPSENDEKDKKEMKIEIEAVDEDKLLAQADGNAGYTEEEYVPT